MTSEAHGRKARRDAITRTSRARMLIVGGAVLGSAAITGTLAAPSILALSAAGPSTQVDQPAQPGAGHGRLVAPAHGQKSHATTKGS